MNLSVFLQDSDGLRNSLVDCDDDRYRDVCGSRLKSMPPPLGLGWPVDDMADESRSFEIDRLGP